MSSSISKASIVLSSRISALALIRAFSSSGGASCSILAISRVCCFDRAYFLFAAIDKRVPAIFSCALSFDALYPHTNDMVVIGGLCRAVLQIIM
jgi:hypothetical protein